MRRASRREFHLVYKTTCLITGRWYIGIHSTDQIEDGYMGSGQRLNNSLKKHGEENHVREIIEFLSSREELCIREAELVTEETLKDPLCMNLMAGGSARKFPAGEDTRMRMRLAKLGKKQSPELIEKRRQACMGRVQTEETRAKLRAIAKEQWKRRYAGDETAVGKRVKIDA